MKKVENYINHIALVLDSSWSMSGKNAQELIKVADNQIAYLARRSKELDQETRVTIYSFNSAHNIKCLVYDKDVLRLPSISDLYRVSGNTALVDATMLALEDLALTPEKYGEHAFLIYVLTDGEENDSQKFTQSNLKSKIQSLPDHWTIAAFVPDMDGVAEAKRCGFPKDNISVWDTASTKGVAEAGEKIRQTTEQFMVNRTKGIRGSKNLFTIATPSINTISNNLKSLHFGQYRLLEVEETGRIDEFVESNLRRPYKLGEAYYQLMKPEKIQAQKEIAIFYKGNVYIGKEARQLLGLPDYEVKVNPNLTPEYQVFVQSTSVNRKLIAGTQLLILS